MDLKGKCENEFKKMENISVNVVKTRKQSEKSERTKKLNEKTRIVLVHSHFGQPIRKSTTNRR